jgi:hypothetical protein
MLCLPVLETKRDILRNYSVPQSLARVCAFEDMSVAGA